MVPGGGGVGGEKALRDAAVVRDGSQSLEIEGGGDEDDAIERNRAEFLLAQCASHGGGARRAVTLAAQILRRVPSAMLREPESNEMCEHVGVLAYAPELLVRVAVDGPGVARADRIDEHDVRDIERRMHVRDDRQRTRAVVAGITGHDHAFRA